MDKDADDRVRDSVELVFRKFRELGSVRQVMLWLTQSNIELPVLRQSPNGSKIAWQRPGYHNVLEFLRHPIYAGAYVFGRRGDRTRVVDGRARKTSGQRKPIEKWNVLLRDHHPGYITWAEYEKHQSMLAENAHMQTRTSRKSGRGGRALLTGMLRCGRCGRMMRVF